MQENLLNIPHQLITERIIIRQYKEGDGLAFFELIQENKERLLDSFPLTLTNTADEISSELYIQSRIAEWYEQKSFSFGIWSKDQSKLIGHISIKNIDWVIPKAELAYFISKDFEGMGLMSVALNVIIKFCFEDLKINRLFLRIMTDNPRSYKLAEKFGFKREGTLREDHRTFNGNLVDLFIYGLIIKDYKLL